MFSSILAGLRADLQSSCQIPKGWQALSKHSQIRSKPVNRKVPRKCVRVHEDGKTWPPRWLRSYQQIGTDPGSIQCRFQSRSKAAMPTRRWC